jgi:hypothetical protein
MKVYVACLVDLDNTHIVGVYTSEDVALSKLDKAMDELFFTNEDFGVQPFIQEAYVDDIENDNYL